MNYRYFTTTTEENEVEVRTNDIRVALASFFDDVEAGRQTRITDGCTGEILAIANDPNHADWATEEMCLMMIGYLASEQWGEGENAEPACDTCGGDVVDGVCQYCGRCVECEDEPIEVDNSAPICAVRCDALPADLIDLLEQMVAEGKAIKL